MFVLPLRSLRSLQSIAGRLRRLPPSRWPLAEFGVADGAALYALAYLLSAALGILRQILFNAQFGIGEDAAAYYAAFRLPETIGVLIAGGALTNAMVPVLLRVAARDGEAAAHRLLDRTLTLLLALFVPLAAFCAVAAPAFVRDILAPGLSPASQALAADLSRVMLLELLLLVSEAVLVSLLVSRGQLLLPAVSIAIHNITLIGGILLAGAVPGVGIYGPTIGAVLDGLLQVAVIVPGLRRRGYRLRPELAPADPDLRLVLVLLGPSALSALVNYGGGIADTAFASLAGAAALGALTNALLLVGLPIRLLGMAIGQAALPRLSALALAENRPALRLALRRALMVACGLAAFTSLALLAFGRPVVALLFERGAFDAAAGDLTYSMLAVLSLGLPAYVATEVASRALTARLDTRTPLLANLGQLAARIALMLALTPVVGALAVPIAFAASAAGEALALILVLRYSLRETR